MVRQSNDDDLTSQTKHSNDVNDDLTSPLVGRVMSKLNASNNSFVGRGVGRGQTTHSNLQASTSAPRFGLEVGRGAGRGGRYFHPYQRPAGTNQTSTSTTNGTRSSSVVFLNSEGEEVEEEENAASENLVRSNDDRLHSSFIEDLFNRRRLVFEINERYAESLISRRIHALERENLQPQVECQRLNAQLR